MQNLFQEAKACLALSDPQEKQQKTCELRQQWLHGELVREHAGPVPAIGDPGRPARPELVPPRALRSRKLTTEAGRAVLVHALAHIEFNAINLALDAIYRFREMPDAYYGDWLQVAEEEAYHFSLLRERLQSMGRDYGDFPAHNGLWEMACDTADDVMVRMALVPRVLEARGLDVTPAMIERLTEAGDTETVNILQIIFRDEIGHVEIGSRWFRYCCAERGLSSAATFKDLLERYMKGRIKGPFAEQARRQAGFDTDELLLLQTLSHEGRQ